MYRLPGLFSDGHKKGYTSSRTDDIFDQLNEAKYFSKRGLRSGYCQIRFDNESILLTAFHRRYCHLEFLVLSIRLTNALTNFMTLKNEVRTFYVDRFVVVYFGDVLVYSQSVDGHVEHLRIVTDLSGRHMLYENISKCVCAAIKVGYLGLILGSSGISAHPEKVKRFKDGPKSYNKKDVHSV